MNDDFFPSAPDDGDFPPAWFDLDPLTREIAQAAAAAIVDEDLDYAAARRRAVQDLGLERVRAHLLPSPETLEDAVRAHLRLFHADTWPQELRALREAALTFLKRLPFDAVYVRGAVWRGTATRLSCVHAEIYSDDPKLAEMQLLDQGWPLEQVGDGRSHDPVLHLPLPVPAWREMSSLYLYLLPREALHGALKADTRGRRWRGTPQELADLLEPE
ncbi:hypothetical protein [Amphibiibacter pelophylacis]|uniref:Uncharacterized protein n=1 Tax=Amphibiibacter pelophylacis TaxID=1799477 RepID=A0ACC6P2K8_9BURK